MAEWSKASVLKTEVGATLPGVRIPLSPPIEIGIVKDSSLIKPLKIRSLNFKVRACDEFLRQN